MLDSPEICFYLDGVSYRNDFLLYFPNISLSFNNSLYNWTSQEYFISNSENSSIHCIAIQPYPFTILGSKFMLNKQIFFDYEKSLIEINDANCFNPNSRKLFFEDEN